MRLTDRDIVNMINKTNVVYVLSHLVLVLGGALFVFVPHPGDWSRQIGLSLMAAGIAGNVVLVHVLLSQRTADQLEVLQRFGITYAHSARATRIKHEYDSLLAKANSNIDILAFGLRALREDFREDFVTWKSKAKVRVLLIDPEYPSDAEYPTSLTSVADLRDIDELRRPGTISDDVKAFIRETGSLLDDRFQIRLYTCLPTVNFFRVDNEAFWGPYLVREQGRNTPTLLVRRGIIFDSLSQHFNRIWEEESLSRPVPDSWHTEP